MEVRLPMQVSIACKQCGAQVDFEPDSPILKMANDYGTFCDACMATQTASPVEPHVPRIILYATICPPCFEDTRIARLPCQAKSEQAINWHYGPDGLNLWGEPGTGKTRTMGILLQGLLQRGYKVVAFGPGDFRRLCESKNHKRGVWLERLCQVDVLFFDDLDKMNLTAEMEKDLFAVLTKRMGRKPVMMTGNATARGIEYQFRLGEAMVRRVRDHCRSIHFAKTDIDNQPVKP